MYFFAKRLAFNVFHSYEVQAVMLANLVDVCHIWVIQGRGCLSFLYKAAHAVAIGCEICRQNFQGYFAVQLGVLRQVNLPHSTHAELRANFIATETSTWSDWQRGMPPCRKTGRRQRILADADVG